MSNRGCSPTFAFNRTRMELKRINFLTARVLLSTFNRTRMELKLVKCCCNTDLHNTFNRTRMELKLYKKIGGPVANDF